MAMQTHAPCKPGTGHDHKPADHDECVTAWYQSMRYSDFNTRTCATSYNAVVLGNPEHDRCGPHCPGPDTEWFRQAVKARQGAMEGA